MAFTTAAIIAGIAVAGAATAAASASRNSPEAPDYAAANREGIMADLETLPIRRQIDAAARAGAKVTYIDPKTGKEKTADFTGLGDADLSRIQLEYGLESADDIARATLDLQSKYGEEAIRQRLKELELSDPEGWGIRKEMGAQIQKDLKSGKRLDDATYAQVVESERAGQAARGNITGQSSAAAEAFGVGEAGIRLYQQRLANASAFLSGASPQAQFSQISGAQQGPVAFNPQSPASGIGVNPNAGAAGANYALGATNLNQQAAQYNQAPWQAFLGSLTGAGVEVGASAAMNKWGG
jgi:hypothetical protein